MLSVVPTTPLPPRQAKGAIGLSRMTFGELVAFPFAPREHLVAPWLRQGESVLLYAPSGLGKTMLALTVALAVAGGGKVLGWECSTPRPVLLVDGEMHAQDLQSRLMMLAEAIVGLDMDAAMANLSVICRQHQGGGVEFPDLATAAGQDVVLEQAGEIGAELVIVDNLTTCARLEDENGAASMAPVLQFLMRLKQAGRGCVLVHHAGKGATASYRGSSALATTFEVILALRPVDGRAPGLGAGFELSWEKYRGEPSGATRDAVAELAGVPVSWTLRPAAHTERAALIDAVLSGRFKTQREVAQHLGWNPAKVSRMRTDIVGKGEVTSDTWEEALKGGEEAF